MLPLRKYRSRIIVVMLTIMALLSVQTQLFHTHSPHSSFADQSVHDHHHNQFHLAPIDLDDDEHDVASEVDLSSKGVVKTIKFSGSLLAVLAFMLLLFPPLPACRRAWPGQHNRPFNSFTPFLRPPLRAPPH